jgi:hypothetical protein
MDEDLSAGTALETGVLLRKIAGSLPNRSTEIYRDFSQLRGRVVPVSVAYACGTGANCPKVNDRLERLAGLDFQSGIIVVATNNFLAHPRW